jgi:hypothetical protein
MASQSAQDLDALFQDAVSEQDLSPATIQALQAVDIGENMQAALGTPADQVKASRVLLVRGLLDDSGSIRFAGNSQVMRDGQNDIRQALIDTKQGPSIQMAVSYMNKGLLCGYRQVDAVPVLDEKNYNPTGGTPLYREFLSILKDVVLKAQEFTNNGVNVQSITYLATDGANEEHGGTVFALHILPVVQDLLKSEQHIICGVGIDDASYNTAGQLTVPGTDFKAVFMEMGIPEQWIIDVKCPPKPGESEKDRRARLRHEILAAFGTISQSAARASQTAGNASAFSQTAVGGFGAP